jgi:predicted O-methyltransferase YrrM
MSKGLRRVAEFLPAYCVALLNIPRLFLVGPLDFAGREMIRRIGWHFGWPPGPRANRLPQVPPPDVCCGSIVDPLGSDESISCAELLIILHLVRPRQPHLVFEFGTAEGRSALNLAANLPGAMLYTIDREKKTRSRFSSHPAFSAVVPILEDSSRFDHRPFSHRADVVLVDAAHDERSVRKNSLTAIEIARPDGLVIWHDYARHWGVTAALHRLRREDSRFLRLVRIAGTSLATLDLRLQDAVAEGAGNA